MGMCSLMPAIQPFRTNLSAMIGSDPVAGISLGRYLWL